MAFANVKTIDTTKAKPRKASDKLVVEVPGLADYALVDSLVKNLTTIKKTLWEEVKEFGLGVFLDNANGRRPANFRGVDGKAEASIELRKRTSLSPLSQDEVDQFDANGVPYETVEEVTELFAINPVHAGNATLMAEVEKALAKVKNCPLDLIVKQESKAKRVVTDESIETVFAKDLTDLVPAVTCIAVKAQTKAGLAEAVEFVSKSLYSVPPSTVKADLKASLKK
jgi:hypothetical protein